MAFLKKSGNMALPAGHTCEIKQAKKNEFTYKAIVTWKNLCSQKCVLTEKKKKKKFNKYHFGLHVIMFMSKKVKIHGCQLSKSRI